jgi:Mg2+ and Co2+ transporter CorA
MAEPATHGLQLVKNGRPEDSFQVIDDLGAFSKAVESATGLSFDFGSLTELNTNFLQESDQYLILNVKDVDVENPDNLLFLSDSKAFLYSKKPPTPDALQPFEGVAAAPFGRATILAFVTLNKVLDSFKRWLEYLIGQVRELDEHFSYANYRDLSLHFERFDDMLEEFHDLLLKLEERGVKQVDTRAIAIDYSVLIAKNLSLQGRCGRRISMLKDLVREHEMQATTELNRRIERLSEVVRRLTAVTVILMLPTLVASHYGMNLQMPELQVPWAYPAVIVSQVSLLVIGILIFRKIGWL